MSNRTTVISGPIVFFCNKCVFLYSLKPIRKSGTHWTAGIPGGTRLRHVGIEPACLQPGARLVLWPPKAAPEIFYFYYDYDYYHQAVSDWYVVVVYITIVTSVIYVTVGKATAFVTLRFRIFKTTEHDVIGKKWRQDCRGCSPHGVSRFTRTRTQKAQDKTEPRFRWRDRRSTEAVLWATDFP